MLLRDRLALPTTLQREIMRLTTYFDEDPRHEAPIAVLADCMPPESILRLCVPRGR